MNKKTKASSTKLAVQCPNCQATVTQLKESISVNALKEVNGEWEVEGKCRLSYCVHGQCSNCGMVFDAIRHEVPIQFGSLKCPQCNQSKALTCRAKELKLVKDAYRFSAIVRCEQCGNRPIRKLLRRLWQISRIKLSFTGVEVETNGSKDA